MRILYFGNVVMLFFHICTNTKIKMNFATTLLVLLYDGETKSVILREAYRLGVLENKILLRKL